MNADTSIVAMGIVYFVGTYLHGVEGLGEKQTRVHAAREPNELYRGGHGNHGSITVLGTQLRTAILPRSYSDKRSGIFRQWNLSLET